jgi:2-iminobutanoate/2-iminopropanoate deaminase
MPVERVLPNPALRYSPGMLVHGDARTLYISGQIGMDAAGQTRPDFAGQAEQAWQNLEGVLTAAGMTLRDVVKVAVFLTSRDHYAAFIAARAKVLGDHKPASTLLIVSGLALPELLVEIEAIAVVTG